MNLQLKQTLSYKAFDIYKGGDDLEIIAFATEGLLSLHNVSFLRENVTTTINGTEVKNAHDEFVEALDQEEILHPQHMKVIIEDHFNFLHATSLLTNKAA